MSSIKLGEQVAQNILQTLIDQRWDGDDLLGSETDLMTSYNAGRASLREAVHLLELHGVAVMQRGPGGGLLVLRSPSAGAIPQSIRSQLRSRGLSDEQIRVLLQDFLRAIPADAMQDAGLALRLGSRELIDSL
jgi:DNA-binding FadR family transcriptional regulator